MSRPLRFKESFAVCYKRLGHTSTDTWKQWTRKLHTYMQACEQAENLRGEHPKYLFAVMHLKAL